jgi:hypothetical protein
MTYSEMTELSLNELKAICTERGIKATGHKGRKASYADAIVLADLNAIEQVTEAECDESTVQASEIERSAVVEAIADAWFEQAAEMAEGKTTPAPAHRSAATIAMIPVIMVVAAVALVVMVVRAFAPLIAAAWRFVGGLMRLIGKPKASNLIDYFPELSIA